MRIHSGTKRYHIKPIGQIPFKKYCDKGLIPVGYSKQSLELSSDMKNLLFLDRRDAEQALAEFKKHKEQMIYLTLRNMVRLHARISNRTSDEIWSCGSSEFIEQGVRELDMIIQEEDEPDSLVTELTSSGGLREAIDSYLKSNDKHALFHLNFPLYTELHAKGRILSESGAMMGFNKCEYIEEERMTRGVAVDLSLPTGSYFMEAMTLRYDDKTFTVNTPLGINFLEAFKRMHTPIDQLLTFEVSEWTGDTYSISQPRKIFIDGDRFIWLNSTDLKVAGNSSLTFKVTKDHEYMGLFKTPGFSGIKKGFGFVIQNYETEFRNKGFTIYDVDAESTQQHLSELQELTRDTADFLRRFI